MDKKERIFKPLLIIAISVLCGVLAAICFAGSKIEVKVQIAGVENGASPVQPQVVQTTSAEQNETQPEVQTQAVTLAPAADTTANAEVNTEAPVSEAPSVTQPAVSNDNSSIEKTVALYNKAVNKVKGEATKITRNYNHVSIPEDSIELPSAIQGIAKTAIGTFVKPDDTVQEWTTADDFKLGFPVGGEDYSSHMTADMIESATCTDNGNTYQIEIILKDDAITSPKKGEGYAGVFSTTTASTFEDISIPTVTFNDVKINGIDGSIKCTVDKASERVTAITFSNTDVMYLNVKVAFSTLEAKMNMVQESDFIITYS